MKMLKTAIFQIGEFFYHSLYIGGSKFNGQPNPTAVKFFMSNNH